MRIVKPLLLSIIVLSVFVCADAIAQGKPSQPAPVPAQAAPDGDAPTPAARAKLHPRRPVVQMTQTMPRPAPPVGPYRPVLVPPVATPPPGPVILNGCSNGACYDQNGAHFNGGVGSSLIDQKGRLCSTGPVTAQCF